jgi:hypothetical protein
VVDAGCFLKRKAPLASIDNVLVGRASEAEYDRHIESVLNLAHESLRAGSQVLEAALAEVLVVEVVKSVERDAGGAVDLDGTACHLEVEAANPAQATGDGGELSQGSGERERLVRVGQSSSPCMGPELPPTRIGKVRRTKKISVTNLGERPASERKAAAEVSREVANG